MEKKKHQRLVEERGVSLQDGEKRAAREKGRELAVQSREIFF